MAASAQHQDIGARRGPDFGDADRWKTLASPVTTLRRPLSCRTASAKSRDVAAIVFPVFRAAAPCGLRRLSQADCGIRAMRCLLNARNLDAHGVREIAALARLVSAYDVEFGAATDAVDAIAQLFGGKAGVDGRERISDVPGSMRS
jgi:hypothetical protein